MTFLIEVLPPYGEPFSELRDALIDLGVSFKETYTGDSVLYRATASKEQVKLLRHIAEETGGFVEVIAETLEVKA